MAPSICWKIIPLPLLSPGTDGQQCLEASEDHLSPPVRDEDEFLTVSREALPPLPLYHWIPIALPP